MRMRPTFRTPLVALLALAALAGCGDDDDGGDDASATTTTDASGSTDGGATDTSDLGLVDEGTLTVCSDTPYEPFEFEGPDGEQTGYDIEIVRAIAEDADLELEVIDLPFDGILGRIAAGECDVVASAVTITPERDEQVDFSDPYFDAEQSLLVTTENAEQYASLATLTGRLGVQTGTTGADYATENAPDGVEIVEFEDADGLFGAITSGDIVGILQDFPVNAYRATQDDSLTVVETYETGEQYGFVVEDGDTAMKAFLDDGLATLRDDGRFDEIFATYFGEAAD